MKSHAIYHHLERLSELLRVDARQAGLELGLQPVQLEAMHYLSMCNAFSDTPMAVAEYLGQTKGTVSQTLKVLEKKELLVKQPDANDKRVFHLKLTKKGGSVLQQLVPTAMVMQACENLSPKEQEVVEQALQCLLSSFLSTNKMKSFGVCRSCRYNRHLNGSDYFCDLVQQPLLESDTQLICREHEAS